MSAAEAIQFGKSRLALLLLKASGQGEHYQHDENDATNTHATRGSIGIVTAATTKQQKQDQNK